MKIIFRGIWISVLMTLAAVVSGNVMAKGGLVSLDFDDPPNADSNEITNPWWPLSQGDRFIYFEEEECILGVVDVMINGGQSRDEVNGVAVREILDREFIDEEGECDANIEDPDDEDWELIETTYDWYAQDSAGNVWYFGEDTVAFDHDECDRLVNDEDPEEGCRDGSWAAGEDVADIGAIAEEGIIMLTSPEKGQFYLQEYYEGEAEDMGKILNFKDMDTYFGEQDHCVVIKEWVPLEGGNVEQKFYCEGYGLVLIAGLAGGPTVYEELVYFHAGPAPSGPAPSTE